jgi:hypothetical protein
MMLDLISFLYIIYNKNVKWNETMISIWKPLNGASGMSLKGGFPGGQSSSKLHIRQ